MKKIYDAIRALRPQMHLPYPLQALRVALWHFERSNRGHSHEIDVLAGATTTKALSRHVHTPGFISRRENLHETTRHLLLSLPAVRETWPASPEFEALWKLRDETGLIEMLTREQISRAWSWNLNAFAKGEQEFRMQRVTVMGLRDGYLEISLVIELHQQPLRATRVLRIPTDGFDSLEGSWKLRRDFARALRELPRELNRSPEFAASRIEQVRRDRMREQLDKLFQSFSDGDRTWAFEHWSELRPAALRRAATQARMR